MPSKLEIEVIDGKRLPLEIQKLLSMVKTGWQIAIKISNSGYQWQVIAIGNPEIVINGKNRMADCHQNQR